MPFKKCGYRWFLKVFCQKREFLHREGEVLRKEEGELKVEQLIKKEEKIEMEIEAIKKEKNKAPVAGQGLRRG